MPFIRTVLGDVSNKDCGVIYAHEHLVLDSPLIAAAFPNIHLDNVEVALAEVFDCKLYGVQTMVDAMPCCAGRIVTRLVEISRKTGVNIVASTGLHHERYYGVNHWSARLKSEELAQLFIDDINIGIDDFDYTSPVVKRTNYRAGIIKIATGGKKLDSRSRLLIEAASIAQVKTGAPILTHCEDGQGALEQILGLQDQGVPCSSILLSHIDKIQDLSYHLDIAATGAWLLFDQAILQYESPDSWTAYLISELSNAGYLNQIVLGTDGARRNLWNAYQGEPGLSWLAREFPQRLTSLGLSTADIIQLFERNPATALAFSLQNAES
jgi:phosphotriesterase-related protein